MKLPSIDYTNRIYKEKLAKKAGIDKFTTYTLRHTFAVDFMEKEGKIEDLAVILGHKELKTTRIYGKISDNRLFDAIKAWEGKSVLNQL